MDKINPLLFITDTDPVPEEILDVSGWFETEYITLKLSALDGDIRSAETLNWYLAQGWVSYNKVRGVDVEGGLNYYSTTFYLRRRKLQSERVLQSLINEFTAAYNEGRQINDQRYDEIVAIYASMLDKSEDEINALDLSTTDYEALIAQLTADFGTFDGSTAGMLDGWGVSERARIKLQFDNELATARQGLVSRGMFNTTVWTSVSAGIERRRAEANNDLEDKILARRVALKESSYDRQVRVRTAVLGALDRLFALRKDSKLAPLEMRNNILGAMLNFMERRSDEYPGLGDLAGIAAQLGYGEGNTVAPL